MKSLLAVLLVAACAAPVHAQTAPSTDAQAVIETAGRIFDAMAARDTTALAALLHPQAVLVAIGPAGQVRVEPGREWVRAVAGSTEVWRERIRDPRVEIDGPLATLWAPYDFHLGPAFSHCGTDALQFARQAGSWRLTVATYTVQTEGCPGGFGPLAP